MSNISNSQDNITPTKEHSSTSIGSVGRSANYSGHYINPLRGDELFTLNSMPLSFSVMDYWSWAYSDILRNTSRGVLAEYIVKTAIAYAGEDLNEDIRCNFEPYDLIGPENARIEVKSAAYIQSWKTKHPDKIVFRIAPAKIPDETGDYPKDAVPVRSSDVYIFCIYTAKSRNESMLNLSLWNFYVLPTKVLEEEKPTAKTITFPSLLKLNPQQSDFANLRDSIVKALT